MYVVVAATRYALAAMAFPVLNVQSKLGSPPDDDVYLQIAVDRTRCKGIPQKIEARLHVLETKVLTVPISQVIAFAGMHYRGAVIDLWGRGTDYAQVRHAWDTLSHMNPRTALHPVSKKPKLVVDHSPGTIGGGRSEILGVGVGLYVARELYDLPYRYWYPTSPNARLDYSAPAKGGGKILVEVRGRFRKSAWAKAIDQVHKKISSGGDFTAAAGILFAPRDTANTKSEDVLVLDPAGRGKREDGFEDLRAILRHYAPFFARQGFTNVGAILLELAAADRQTFRNYLRRGDDRLREARMHRTFFVIDGFRFEGTAWEDFVWPKHLTGLPANSAGGAFYWGVWDQVISALRDGRLTEIARMNVRPVSLRGNGRVYVILDDATALKWADSEKALTPRG